MANPAGRAQGRELETDAEPRFNGAQGGPPSDAERQGAVEHSVRVFARKVGRYRDNARLAHCKELHKKVGKLVAEELPKDLSWFNAREIEEYFAKGNERGP
jgi:hypothetical protein